MSAYSRREVLRIGAALAAGFGLTRRDGAIFAAGLDRIARRQERVLWLQAMSCTGCSISLLNTEHPDILQVLTELVSLACHQNVSAAQGEPVLRLIEQVVAEGDYILALEGSLPLGMPDACVIGGKPITAMLPGILEKAKAIVAVGTCASFGGIPAAEGNSTNAVSLKEFMTAQRLPVDKRLVNCPGCPIHPQTLVGTLAYLAAKGYPEVDPELLTPRMFCSHTVHDECPKFHYWEKHAFAERFGDEGCLFKLGCLGPLSQTNCSRSQWNGGVNWCIRAGAPCTACSSQDFARRKSFAFYRKSDKYHQLASADADRQRGAS
jgi:hydrogenase small subunit